MTDDATGERRARLTRRGRIVLGFVAVLLVVGLGAGLWVLRQVNPGGGPGEKVAVDIVPGTSVSAVSEELEDEGVITSAQIFRMYLKVTGGAGTIQAGEYELRRNLSMGEARAALRRGPSIRFERLTIPEGFTLEKIADKVGELPGRSRDKFLAAARSGAIRSKWQPPGQNNLEGLLFPDTYLVTDKEDEAAILRRLVTRFEQVTDEVGLGRAAPPTGLSPYQLIVAASLVESEAKVDEDRPLIASVISNRLQKGMKLQIDATVLYAIGHKDKVLYSDLEVDSPYNTYKIDGLPPTPISASGKGSLAAMLRPADTTFLFYVLSDKNGKHAFATTASEFEALKAEARRKGLI
ncbi:MAG TPA: endolytic transglycosylase MltG [Acidimicrobiia bacterium]|nr:endolytic transglycosylase MltG [Acidimicrobiia bacterium]